MQTIVKPFNHIAASSIFRLACSVEFMEEDQSGKTVKKVLTAFMKYREYADQLKHEKRKRTNTVKGRRKSIERIVKTPFTKTESQVVYSMAIEVEKLLESHYQIKSGETYVLLSKASMQFYDAAKKIIANKKSGSATMKKEEIL